MVKITKVKDFKLELPTNKNATTTKPKDSSKDKDYSIKTVNQDQNTEELNLNSSNSDKAKKKKLTKKEITKSLKQYGFNDKDIKRLLEGKITIKKLLKEIEKDPVRKAELYKANYIQVFGLNFDNMDDLNSYIEKQKKLIETYNKQLEKLNNDNSGQDFYNIAVLLIKGKSLDEALEKTAYWVDPQGNKYYTNPYYQRENENKKFIEVPYKDVYSEEQLKDIRSVLKNGKWNNSEESSELYIKLAENKNSFLSKKLEKTKELKEKLSKTTNEYNYYSEIANYINQEVNHQTKMIDPYTSKEDFLKKSNFNKDSLKKLKEIGERYNNTQVRHNNSMQEMVVSDKDEIVDIISCMLNGKGNIDNGFTTINGIQYTLESKDGLIDHYKKWKKVITDDEKKCFNYIYNTKGKEEAYKYLQDISNELDNRWLLRQQYEDKEFAKKNSFLASVGSVLHTPIEGLSSIYYSLNSKITGEKIRRSDVYSAGDIMRAAIAEDINNYWKKRGNATLGKNLSFWYSTGMSMADTAELIALTVATGGTASPLLSATVMGSRAYVSTLNNALDKGLSDEQAILLATSSAVAETAMENYSVGHLLNLEGKLGESVTKNAGKIASKIGNKKIADIVTKGYYIAASAVSQGLAEGEEELATEIVNYLADIFIAKDMSDFCKSIENYTKKGLSDEQALLKTVKDFGSQLNQAFTGGFASGICFGGFSGASSTIKTSNSIAQNLYNDLKGDTKAQKFANALEINQQEIETYSKALEKLKKGELLTQEEHKLLINGTTESQAGLFDNNRKKNIEKLAKETNSSSKVAQIAYDNNYPIEIAQIIHDNKCSVEVALNMYNYKCSLEVAQIAYDNNCPVEIAQIMHDNKCRVEIALDMYNYNCDLEVASNMYNYGCCYEIAYLMYLNSWTYDIAKNKTPSIMMKKEKLEHVIETGALDSKSIRSLVTSDVFNLLDNEAQQKVLKLINDNFNLEHFMKGQYGKKGSKFNDGGVFLATDSQFILTDNFSSRNILDEGDHGTTVNTFYHAMYNKEHNIDHFRDSFSIWQEYVLAKGDICIQLVSAGENCDSLVWLPNVISENQYKMLEEFNNKIKEAYANDPGYFDKNPMIFTGLRDNNHYTTENEIKTKNNIDEILEEAKNRIGKKNPIPNENIVGTDMQKLNLYKQLSSLKWDEELFVTKEGRKIVNYLKSIYQTNKNYTFTNGVNIEKMLNQYYKTIIDLDEKTLNVHESFYKEAAEFLLDSKNEFALDVIQIMEDKGYALEESYNKKYNELRKYFELAGYDQTIYELLKKTAGKYVSEEKLKSIFGSSKLEYSEDFNETIKKLRMGNAAAFNNGIHSITSLNQAYPLKYIKSNICHEMNHQISYNEGNFENNQYIINAGIQKTIKDYVDLGNLKIRNKTIRKGLNECCTELLSSLSLGENHVGKGYCNYDDGVGVLEYFIEEGIITVEQIKECYYTNNGELLEDIIHDSLSKLKIYVSKEDIRLNFDKIISEDGATKAKGGDYLYNLIMEITRKKLKRLRIGE